MMPLVVAVHPHHEGESKGKVQHLL